MIILRGLMQEFLKRYAIGSAQLTQLIRELPASTLIPILETASQTSGIARYDISVCTHIRTFPGATGDKVIPTFNYTTRIGGSGQVTMFVKRNRSPELAHYRELAAMHLPIPELYGYIIGKDQGEVIFTEYLPLDFNTSSNRDLKEALELLARVNTAAPPSSYKGRSAGTIAGQRSAAWKATVGEFWPEACDGEFGSGLGKFCATHSADDVYKQIERTELSLSSMKIGFNIHAFYEIRRSSKTGCLKFVDLGSCGNDIRFKNIADACIVIESKRRKGAQVAPVTEILTHYFARYCGHKSGPVASEGLLEELGSAVSAMALDEFCGRFRLNEEVLRRGGGKWEEHPEIQEKLTYLLETALSPAQLT